MNPGEWVKAARLKAHLTQVQLAERLSITVVYLSYIENNKKRLNKTLMLHVARICSVPDYKEELECG